MGNTQSLEEVVVSAKADEVSGQMDKKTFAVARQYPSKRRLGVLQAISALPGVAVQDGKVQLRGSEKVACWWMAKQTALSGLWQPNGPRQPARLRHRTHRNHQ